MSNDYLKVPKKLTKVALWVHPEGRVVGSLYTREQSPSHAGEEDPCEALNQEETFVVLKREEPDEVRFYNKSSIIRLEYEHKINGASVKNKPISCRLHMMDGAVINGDIIKTLPPEQNRLYDYLNNANERFIKIHINEDTVYLVNKNYINQATEPGTTTSE